MLQTVIFDTSALVAKSERLCVSVAQQVERFRDETQMGN